MKKATLLPNTRISTPENTYAGGVEWETAIALVQASRLHADFFVEKAELLAAAFPETKVPTAKNSSEK